MADKIPYEELSLIKLEKIHDRLSFGCNDSDLTEFFKEDALNYQEKNAAVTYICIHKETIVGFVTIATCSVTVKLDERKEIGEYMIKKIAKKALELSAEIGLRLIIVDSKPHVVNWYERFGFKKLEKYKTRQNPVMYIDLLKAAYA